MPYTPCLSFVGCGCAHWIPLFYKLAASHAGSGDVDEPYVIILVFLFPFFHIFINVNRDAMKRWKAVEFKMFTPENIVRFGLASCTSKEGIIKAQFTEIFLFRGEVLGFNDP